MNQLFAAGAALAIALVVLGIGKTPKEIFKTQSKKNFLRTSSTLVEKKKPPSMHGLEELDLNKIDWEPPQNSREIILLRRKLFKKISEGPDSRLEAVKIASIWGHKSIIPLLKRGLRDTDSRVVILSAEAIDQFRGNYL